MNSSVISKIEKARRYAQERERVRFTSLSVRFHGENGDHNVELSADQWRCSCDFFLTHRACAHSMAMERILDGMLAPEVMSNQVARTGG